MLQNHDEMHYQRNVILPETDEIRRNGSVCFWATTNISEIIHISVRARFRKSPGESTTANTGITCFRDSRRVMQRRKISSSSSYPRPLTLWHNYYICSMRMCVCSTTASVKREPENVNRALERERDGEYVHEIFMVHYHSECACPLLIGRGRGHGI